MERANPAQLAARNIKAAKGRRRGPIASNPSAPQAMSFGGSGTGFGGSVGNAGSFNFSAPAGPSFPPSTFGNNLFGNSTSGDTSENEDPRADTTGEEAARSKIGFQQGSAEVANPFGAGPSLFGQTSSQEQPSSNPFSFNTQPASAASSQPNPPFSFNATQPASTSLFGSATQQQPAAAPFSFNTPSTPAINFGTGPTQEKPGNNLFGSFGQQNTQPREPGLFGSSTPRDKPANTPFVFGSSTAQPTTPSINFSSTPAAQPAPSVIKFNSTAATMNSSINIFGGSQPEKPANPLFGATKPGDSSSFNAFGSTGQSAPAPNLFGSQPSATRSMGNMFGSAQQKPAPTSSASNLFGGSQPAQNGSNPFHNSPSKSDTFAPQKAQSTSTSTMFAAQPNGTAASIFNKTDQQPASSTGDLFGNLNKPVDHSTPQTNNSLTNGTMNTGIPATTGTTSASIFSSTTPAPSTGAFGASKSFFPATTAAPAELAKAPRTPSYPFGSPQPAASNATNGNSLFSLAKPASASQPASAGLFTSASQAVSSPLKSSNLPPASPSKNGSQPSSSNSLNGQTNGMTTGTASNNAFTEMAAAAEIPQSSLQNAMPARFNTDQRKQFVTVYRLRALNQALENFFASAPIGLDVSSATRFYGEKRLQILNLGSVDKSIVGKANQQENESPNKRNKSLESSVSLQSQLQNPASPQNFSNQSQPQAFQNGSTTPSRPPPQAQPFPSESTSLYIHPSQASTTLATSPSKKGKRRAEEELDKDIYEAQERELRKASSSTTPNGASNTSALFRQIVDSPAADGSNSAQASTAKKVKPLPANTPKENTEDKPRSNPFASLKMPSATGPASTIFSPKPAASSSNAFTPQPAPAASNPFQPTPVPSTSGAGIVSPVKVPKFGLGGVNFMAQFTQKASEDKYANEKKLLQDAIDEDYDSDEETKEEFTVKWKVKRAEELKAIDEATKNAKSSGFKPTPSPASSNNNSAVGSVNGSRAPTPSILDAFKSGQIPAITSNMFGSMNGSRTPTPSVFDNVKSSQPLTPSNIFAHLDSGANSGNDNSDSGDEDVDADSENKDPSYQPGADSSGPGTPVDETGAGIASAKKPFSFGATKPGLFDKSLSQSGASTPAGGLFGNSAAASGSSTPSMFDRITKDENGNPKRQLPSEEKENKEPGQGSNLFANTTNPFAKSFTESDAPVDQTWKPNTPIKFAGTSPGSNPSVSVTAATPPKASPFAGLFGNTANSKPATTSAGVGFSFGALPSTPSSLFPSAVGSGVSSRATSPGGTTDGDGESEADDTPKDEQIVLSGGGAGEEEEVAVHEVRAKALLYQKPEEEGEEDGQTSAWAVRGVGPVRILKHKESGATRILMRADPRGTIVLNKAILPGTYEAIAKTIKIMVAGDEGQPFETWLLQVKTPEFASELAKALEASQNK